MALTEQSDATDAYEEQDLRGRKTSNDRKLQSYSNLFFLLQNEPWYLADLCKLVSLDDMDMLLQMVMFTLYGNQYEERGEHLLLAMFQSVLSARVQNATDPKSLLRINTPASRMFSTYARRCPSQSYLKQVLISHVKNIMENPHLNLEIHLHKVYDELVSKQEVPSSLSLNQATDLPEIRKKNLVINISLNELYQMHGLVLKHLEVLASSQDDHQYINQRTRGSPGCSTQEGKSGY